MGKVSIHGTPKHKNAILEAPIDVRVHQRGNLKRKDGAYTNCRT